MTKILGIDPGIHGGLAIIETLSRCASVLCPPQGSSTSRGLLNHASRSAALQPITKTHDDETLAASDAAAVGDVP
jgi:hypothetical protein